MTTVICQDRNCLSPSVSLSFCLQAPTVLASLPICPERTAGRVDPPRIFSILSSPAMQLPCVCQLRARNSNNSHLSLILTTTDFCCCYYDDAYIALGRCSFVPKKFRLHICKNECTHAGPHFVSSLVGAHGFRFA